MNWKELLHSRLPGKAAEQSWLFLFISLMLFFFVPIVCAQEQYKKLSRDAISQIVDGEYDAAIKHFEDYLSEHPRDLESM
jgi:TolA-binding protein